MPEYGPQEVQESLARMAEAASTPEWQARKAEWEQRKADSLRQLKVEGHTYRIKVADFQRRWKAGEVGHVVVREPLQGFYLWLHIPAEIPDDTETPTPRRLYGFQENQLEPVNDPANTLRWNTDRTVCLQVYETSYRLAAWGPLYEVSQPNAPETRSDVFLTATNILAEYPNE